MIDQDCAFTIPNSKNFCGGNFQDWLEVNLIEICNANCSWCIERKGYHPTFHATMETMIAAILATGKKHIILLGGEPLLYKHMKELINALFHEGRTITITTNGFLLSPEYIIQNLNGITNINISIHHFDMTKNREITHILIDENKLKESISALHGIGASVRMNCNAIHGYIDNAEAINNYIEFAHIVGADKVRFAELKQDENNFVDLAKILGYLYGLNDNPFSMGCNNDCVINGMPVNFRQMCGLQTTKRIAPKKPKQYSKKVLYYDGQVYNGWQTQEEIKMNAKNSNQNISDIINSLTNNKLTEEERKELIKLIATIKVDAEKEAAENQRRYNGHNGEGCQY